MIYVDIKKKLGNVNIDVSFSIKDNSVTTVFGQSGAGKTSIINMIAGLITPDEGVISVNGREFFNSSKKINIPTSKRNIGYIFQDIRLFPHLTIKRNLLYGVKNKNNNDLSYTLEDISSLLDISHLLDRMPLKLSGGEKQRVAIGRVLLSKPDLFLMDEPLSSLDTNRKKELLNYINIISNDFHLPILYVTHSIGEMLKISKNILFVENGKLIKYGNTTDVLSELNEINETLNKYIDIFS